MGQPKGGSDGPAAESHHPRRGRRVAGAGVLRGARLAPGRRRGRRVRPRRLLPDPGVHPRAVGPPEAGHRQRRRGRPRRGRGGRERGARDGGVGGGGGWGGVPLAYTVRSPAEVDAVLAEARAAGARIARSGAETSWGGYSGVFVDPDGHPWEVAHNPGWTVHDDGRTTLGQIG